jgi:hypothetical protein
VICANMFSDDGRNGRDMCQRGEALRRRLIDHPQLAFLASKAFRQGTFNGGGFEDSGDFALLFDNFTYCRSTILENLQ